MNRRDFLTLLASAPALALAGGKQPTQNRHLLLIELKGGNDGLNTLVPYRDPAYYRSRPTLALPKDQGIRLDETRAWHPQLAPLMPSWSAGDVAMVEGLGYANPNRSHFRSIDIWHSASDSDTVSKTGWLAAPLGAGDTAVDAVIFGNRVSPVAGGNAQFVSLDSLDKYVKTKNVLTPSERSNSNATLAALNNTHAVGESYRSRLARQPLPSAYAGFPEGKFGRWLGDATRLIASGHAPPLIKLHLNGFDTHADQLDRHAILLNEFAVAVAAMRTELTALGLWERVLIMTYSEFGRRVSENGSAGSDHGTAAPHFLIGGRVRGGFYGRTPSMSELQANDLVHTLDFRSLYKTTLHHWWHLPTQFGLGDRFETIDCIRT